MAAGRAEVVVGPEGLVERGDQVEEGLTAARVAERALVLAALAPAQPAGTRSQHPPGSRPGCLGPPQAHSPAGAQARGLRWGQCLQHVGLTLLAELLEHVLVVACHLARIALNPWGAGRTVEDPHIPRPPTPALGTTPHLPMMCASPVSTVNCELMASKLEFSNSFMFLCAGCSGGLCCLRADGQGWWSPRPPA